MSNSEDQSQGLLDESLPDPMIGSEDGEEEHADPGVLEGMTSPTKDGGKHEPPVGSPRWNEIYRKAKETERKLGEITKAADEKESLIKQMQEHNRQLAETVKGIQDGAAKKEENTGEAILADLSSLLGDLKQKRSEAAELGDTKLMLEIQDRMDEVKEELFLAKTTGKKTPDVNAEVGKALQARTVQEAQQVIFGEEPWLNPTSPDFDPVLAGAANTIDAHLAKDPAWAAKPIVEQFREVAKRVKEKFNGGKVDTPKVAKKPIRFPSAASVNAGGGVEGETVTLTAEQRKVARGLFSSSVDPEREYANQLKLMQKGRK